MCFFHDNYVTLHRNFDYISNMIIAIDGFTEANRIRKASELGVGWIGLNFVPGSPCEVRQLSSLTGILPDNPSLQPTGLGHDTELMGIFCDAMPQTIIARTYNYNLGVVRLDGTESTVLIDNLRRSVDPDIRPGLKIVKTLKVLQPQDVMLGNEYAPHADYLLFDMGDALWSWLSDYEGDTPFLISAHLDEGGATRMRSFHHPRLAGYSLGAQMKLPDGQISIAKVRQLMARLNKM